MQTHNILKIFQIIPWIACMNIIVQPLHPKPLDKVISLPEPFFTHDYTLSSRWHAFLPLEQLSKHQWGNQNCVSVVLVDRQ